jgi:Lrp/AsnC family transcriptional regulator
MIPQTTFSPSKPASDASTGPARRATERQDGERATPRPRRLDRIDRRILRELQGDATLPLARLADRVGLSPTPCWKRVRKLEEAGVIARRVALVDPGKAGLTLTAFVAVTAQDHSPAAQAELPAALAALPEVLEVWRMAGEADFLLKVVTPDMPAFDRFYRQLTARHSLKAVTSHFAMERIAYSTALPIPDEG